MTNHGIHHVTAIAGPARAQSRLLYPRRSGCGWSRRPSISTIPAPITSITVTRPASPARSSPSFRGSMPRRTARRRRDAGDGVPRAGGCDRLLDAPLRREGRGPRSAGKTLRRKHAVFRDPDGMRLALVGVPGAENEPAWASGDVPAEHAIRGFHSVNLLLDDGRADRRDPAPTCSASREAGARRQPGALQGRRYQHRRHHRHPRGRVRSCPGAGRGLGAPHRVSRRR